MTERFQVYRCGVCGNLVEVLHASTGELTCCSRAMRQLRENTTDAATEKHVPVVEPATGGTRIKVGSVAHPMAEDHYIEWIELLAGDRLCRTFLRPGGEPQTAFAEAGEGVVAREYCNLHGLWRTGA